MILDILLWPFMMLFKLFDAVISLLAKPFSKPKGEKIVISKKKVDLASPSALADINNDEVNNDLDKEVKNIRFKYVVKTQENKVVSATIDAPSKVEAESFLISRGNQIIELKEDKLSTTLGLAALSSHGKMRFKDLAFFLTQLSTYIKSGIPLTDSVIILERQAKKKKDKFLYQKIVYELNKGVAFSSALAKQGNVFPKLLVNMLKTSELTGDLPETLDDMADYYRTSDANRKQVISALTYPSVIFVISIAVLTFIMLYVVPQFVEIYGQLGTDLPAITKVIMNLSDYLDKNIVIILVIVVIVAIGLILTYKNVTSFRYLVQWIFMHIPVISNILIYKEVITFTKTFSSLMKHDVFITDSMEMLSRVTNNEIYKVLINDAITNLSNGNGLSPAFKGQWAFPDIAYEMLLTGERTGRLGEMMENVANYYEGEQKNLITQLKSLIEPIMIILLAVIVGIVLLSIVIPMFDIYNSIDVE